MNEKGDLVVSANMTNTGTVAVPALDVTVILLNDCILTNVPQTCRFAAFGAFQNVAPSGIAPGGGYADVHASSIPLRVMHTANGAFSPRSFLSTRRPRSVRKKATI